MGMGAPEAKLIASVTFLAILMTILIQATTTRWLARKLDLLVVEEVDANGQDVGGGRNAP
jgi:cell volume regulation protein A